MTAPLHRCFYLPLAFFLLLASPCALAHCEVEQPTATDTSDNANSTEAIGNSAAPTSPPMRTPAAANTPPVPARRAGMRESHRNAQPPHPPRARRWHSLLPGMYR